MQEAFEQNRREQVQQLKEQDQYLEERQREIENLDREGLMDMYRVKMERFRDYIFKTASGQTGR